MNRQMQVAELILMVLMLSTIALFLGHGIHSIRNNQRELLHQDHHTTITQDQVLDAKVQLQGDLGVKIDPISVNLTFPEDVKTIILLKSSESDKQEINNPIIKVNIPPTVTVSDVSTRSVITQTYPETNRQTGTCSYLRTPLVQKVITDDSSVNKSMVYTDPRIVAYLEALERQLEFSIRLAESTGVADRIRYERTIKEQNERFLNDILNSLYSNPRAKTNKQNSTFDK